MTDEDLLSVQQFHRSTNFDSSKLGLQSQSRKTFVSPFKCISKKLATYCPRPIGSKNKDLGGKKQNGHLLINILISTELSIGVKTKT